MLVLSRKTDEAIYIGDNIRLMVIGIQGDKVRLGIEAPAEIKIHREEVRLQLPRPAEVSTDSAAA